MEAGNNVARVERRSRGRRLEERGSTLLVLGLALVVAASCSTSLDLEGYTFSALPGGAGGSGGTAPGGAGGSGGAGGAGGAGGSGGSGGSAGQDVVPDSDCEPDTRRCVGVTPQSCNAEGTYVDEPACEAPKTCVAATGKCGCVPGTFRPCQGGLLGNCKRGQEECSREGVWSACNVSPGTDSCEQPGDDADCDGTANSNCPCVGDQANSCGTDVGACALGVSTCTDGLYGPCEGAVPPAFRDCTSSADNDCNGTQDQADETCECLPNTSENCPDLDRGCRVGSRNCELAPDGASSTWGECVYSNAGGNTKCDDGNEDTVADRCVDGECRGVECASDNDCRRPDAARCDATGACVPCAANTNCAHLERRGACAAGTCVECISGADPRCNGNVCDSRTRTCTTFAATSANLCDSCVSDAQCANGARCVVERPFNEPDLSPQCFPLSQNGACPTGSGFAGFQAGRDTLDGEEVDICVPRLTTCEALTSYISGRACDDEDDDEACGRLGVCALGPAGFQCTVSCGLDDDCVSDTCGVPVSEDVSQDICPL